MEHSTLKLLKMSSIAKITGFLTETGREISSLNAGGGGLEQTDIELGHGALDLEIAEDVLDCFSPHIVGPVGNLCVMPPPALYSAESAPPAVYYTQKETRERGRYWR